MAAVHILSLVLAASMVAGQEGKPDETCLKPPPGFPERPPLCCDLPFPIEEMKQQFPQCFQTVRPPQQPQNPAAFHQASACLETCVFNRVGFLKAGGKELDEEKMKSKLVAGVPSSWAGAVETSTSTCFSKIKEMKLPQGSCSESPMAFAHCIRRELFLNCPKEAWNDNNDCNMVKKQMEMCPNLPPPPPPGPPQPHH